MVVQLTAMVFSRFQRKCIRYIPRWFLLQTAYVLYILLLLKKRIFLVTNLTKNTAIHVQSCLISALSKTVLSMFQETMLWGKWSPPSLRQAFRASKRSFCDPSVAITEAREFRAYMLPSTILWDSKELELLVAKLKISQNGFAFWNPDWP